MDGSFLLNVSQKKEPDKVAGSKFFRGKLNLQHKKLLDQKHESCKKIVSVNLDVFVHCFVVNFECHGRLIYVVNLGKNFDITKYKSDERHFKTIVV